MKNMNNGMSIIAVNNISLPLPRGKRDSSVKSTMDSNSLRANFITRVSHDLRTPLNSINGAIHYLQHCERPVTKQEKEFYNIISSETENLVGIVENLLDFLKAEQDAKKAVMQIFLEFIAEFLNLGICSVMLDSGSGELAITNAIGLDREVIKRTRVRLGDPIAGWVALKGEPLLIKNIEKDPLFKRSSISQYNTKSLLSMPLKVKDRVIGVINMNNKGTAASFTTRDLRLAAMLSKRVSNMVEMVYGDEYA